MFSVSLTTTFGGTPVSANSNFALFIGNVHTLVTMLHFVFVTGVVFAKLAQVRRGFCLKQSKGDTNECFAAKTVRRNGKVFDIGAAQRVCSPLSVHTTGPDEQSA